MGLLGAIFGKDKMVEPWAPWEGPSSTSGLLKDAVEQARRALADPTSTAEYKAGRTALGDMAASERLSMRDSLSQSLSGTVGLRSGAAAKALMSGELALQGQSAQQLRGLIQAIAERAQANAQGLHGLESDRLNRTYAAWLGGRTMKHQKGLLDYVSQVAGTVSDVMGAYGSVVSGGMLGGGGKR